MVTGLRPITMRGLIIGGGEVAWLRVLWGDGRYIKAMLPT